MITLKSVNKWYNRGAANSAHALKEISLLVAENEVICIQGPSGSGKSTLMHCMAGLDRLSSGEAYIGEVPLSSLNDKQLTRIRRDKVGFIFQSFNLVPTLNIRENVTLPMDLGSGTIDDAWVDEVITTVGLADRVKHRYIIAGLTDKPDPPIGRHIRITGPGFFPRHQPFLNLRGRNGTDGQ